MVLSESKMENDNQKVEKAISFNSNFQTPTQSTDSTVVHNLVQVSLGLIVVLLIIGGAAWFVRKFGNFQVTSKGNLRIIGGLHLGTKERIVLLQVGKEQLVVGVSPGNINKLHILKEPIIIDEKNEISKSSFAERLSEVIKGYKN